MSTPSKTVLGLFALVVSCSVGGCAKPTYGRFIETDGSVYGHPPYERDPDLGGAYGAGPKAGTGIYRMVPIPEAPRAPVEVPKL